MGADRERQIEQAIALLEGEAARLSALGSVLWQVGPSHERLAQSFQGSASRLRTIIDDVLRAGDDDGSS